MSQNELTPRQKRFAAELVAAKSLRDACEQAGVSEATAKRWLKQSAMRALVRELSHQMLEELTRRLRQLGGQAAETLEQAMRSGDASWSARIRAADSVLGHLLKVSELLELEERVSWLEEALKGRSGRHEP